MKDQDKKVDALLEALENSGLLKVGLRFDNDDNLVGLYAARDMDELCEMMDYNEGDEIIEKTTKPELH